MCAIIICSLFETAIDHKPGKKIDKPQVIMACVWYAIVYPNKIVPR